MRSRQAGTALTFACAQPVARRITKIRRHSALRCASQAVGLGWDDSPGAEEDLLTKDPSLSADPGTRSAAPDEERPYYIVLFAETRKFKQTVEFAFPFSFSLASHV